MNKNKIIKSIISFIKLDPVFYPVTRRQEFRELSPFFKSLLVFIAIFAVAILGSVLIR